MIPSATALLKRAGKWLLPKLLHKSARRRPEPLPAPEHPQMPGFFYPLAAIFPPLRGLKMQQRRRFRLDVSTNCQQRMGERRKGPGLSGEGEQVGQTAVRTDVGRIPPARDGMEGRREEGMEGGRDWAVCEEVCWSPTERSILRSRPACPLPYSVFSQAFLFLHPREGRGGRSGLVPHPPPLFVTLPFPRPPASH